MATVRRGFASKIADVEYFYEAERDQAKAQGLGGVGAVDANGEARDYVKYLGATDNDAASPGTFRVLSMPGHASAPTSSPFRSIRTGDVALGSMCRHLVAGKHPDSGEVALAGRRYRGAVHNPGGFDLQVGTAKSVSVAAIFDLERRDGIRAAERKGYDDAIGWAFDQGLFAVRVQDGKGATTYQPAARIAMAVYTHASSRAEDPHDHHHGAVFAMCERQDGELATMSNFLLKKYGGAINAYKRASEAGALKALGYAVERDPDSPRNYRLKGFPPKVAGLFSKRRAEIEALAKKAGVDTAHARAVVQEIAFDSRAAKKFTGLAKLEAKWDRELQAAGWTRETIVFGLEAAARAEQAQRAAETAEQRTARLDALVLDSIRAIQRETAVFSRARLYQESFEAIQCEVEDGAEAARVVAALEQSGALVRVAEIAGEPVYTTGEMIDLEKETLRRAWRGKGRGPTIDAAKIEAVLVRSDAALKESYGPDAGIKEEQRNAVRHALSGDQFTVTQGYAGTGKSYITALQREVVEAQGFKVYGTAPSWKATDVLKSDSGLKADNCVVLAKLLHDHHAGKIKFDSKSFIILDEAGMVSTRDMAELVRIADETGASLRMQGDKGQFRAVDAGQPFAAMQRLLGAATLRDIQRQKGEFGAWQKAASILLDDANNCGDAQRGAAMIGQALRAYDDAGRIVWADDDEAAFAAAVDKVMEWRTAHPGDSTAIVTEWNSNARAASVLLRERLKGAGQIAAEDTELAIVARGSKDNGKTIRMSFAAGEEVIFGENVKLAERTIRNNDLARIKALDASDPENPSFLLRFEDGQEVRASYSELVGRREEGEAQAPRMQHSYVITGHSSQGATYARTVDLTLEGHGREATLVASTRHRLDHFKVIATDRLAEGLEAKSAATIILGKGGALVAAPEEDDDSQASKAALDDVKKAFFAESAGHDPFGNVSDHFADIHAWAGIERPVEAVPAIAATPPASIVSLRSQAIMAQRMAPYIRAQAAKAAAAANRPPPPVKAAPARPMPFQGRPSRRVTDEERAEMERVDLVAFASQDLGGKLVEKWQGGGMVDFAGDRIGISQVGGRWLWTERSGGRGAGHAGVIYNLVERVKNLSYGEALHWLRDRLGTWRAEPLKVEAVSGSRPVDAKPRRDQPALLGWFENLSKEPSKWLTQRRGICPEILSRFASEVRAEPEGEKAGNRWGAAFAHRDAEGRLTGFARRGPSRDVGGQGFSGMAGGSERCLFQAGDLHRPERIYVTETAIDSLSLYQHDGQPDRTAVLATDGSFSSNAREIVRALAARHPEAVWHVGQDNDAPKADVVTGEVYVHGHRHRDAVIDAVRDGNPSARIETRNPDDSDRHYKDWNDRLRGPEFSVEAVAEKREAERLARQAAEEALRLAQEAEVRRGPRL